jgi:hypothetical protein
MSIYDGLEVLGEEECRWAGGSRPHLVRIRPEVISGRGVAGSGAGPDGWPPWQAPASDAAPS